MNVYCVTIITFCISFFFHSPLDYLVVKCLFVHSFLKVKIINYSSKFIFIGFENGKIFIIFSFIKSDDIILWIVISCNFIC